MDSGFVATHRLGKDGGAKLDIDGIADWQRVFQGIDGMPMRRQEMDAR